MGDLAVLGMIFKTEGAEAANRQLDAIKDKSGAAEKATDALSGGMSRADSAMAVMVASIERTVKEMAELMRLQQGVISTTNAQAGATAALNDELQLSLIHISEPTRLLSTAYAVFCLKKKKICLLYIELNPPK